jgi:AraC family transcriptional regulator of adaptative response/methylated-DNA-[protein]-cysteine methyltransferase
MQQSIVLERPRLAVAWLASPFGPCLAAFTPRGLCRLGFPAGRAQGLAELRGRFPGARLVPATAAQRALLARAFKPGAGLPALDLKGTPFQRRVWAALRAIPFGATLSYAQLARRAGRPRAVRAAASACKANPVAWVVPCHRALRSDGSLGGFAWGLETKRRMLAWEQARR